MTEPVKRLALIDGSSLAHRSVHAAAGAEKDYERAISRAPDILQGLLQRVLADMRPRYTLCAAEGAPFIRTRMDPNYKSQRAAKPAEFYEALDACTGRYTALLGHPPISIPGYEADDVLASLAARVHRPGWRSLIVTSDKDLAAAVDDHTDLLLVRNGGERVHHTSLTVTDVFGVPPGRIAMWKAIAGDKSDSIAGVAGLGPKAATDLAGRYATPGELWAAMSRCAIAGPQARKLAAGREDLERSYELARLHDDLDVAVDWARCAPVAA
jgi:5'-3' exonuclease